MQVNGPIPPTVEGQIEGDFEYVSHLPYAHILELECYLGSAE
jgi:hypothetical protein